MAEVWERSPSILKTSIAGSLVGDDGGLRALTTYLEDINSGLIGR
jgi:hypothetical protein